MCLVPEEARRGVGSPGIYHLLHFATSIKNIYEMPCGFWAPNPGLLEEQQVLVTAEASLQPCWHNFKELFCRTPNKPRVDPLLHRFLIHFSRKYFHRPAI